MNEKRNLSQSRNKISEWLRIISFSQKKKNKTLILHLSLNLIHFLTIYEKNRNFPCRFHDYSCHQLPSRRKNVISPAKRVMYYDLNVPWTSANDPELARTIAFLDERTLASPLLNLMIKLSHYKVGYNVIALNFTLSGKFAHKIVSKIQSLLYS